MKSYSGFGFYVPEVVRVAVFYGPDPMVWLVSKLILRSLLPQPTSDFLIFKLPVVKITLIFPLFVPQEVHMFGVCL